MSFHGSGVDLATAYETACMTCSDPTSPRPVYEQVAVIDAVAELHFGKDLAPSHRSAVAAELRFLYGRSVTQHSKPKKLVTENAIESTAVVVARPARPAPGHDDVLRLVKDVFDAVMAELKSLRAAVITASDTIGIQACLAELTASQSGLATKLGAIYESLNGKPYGPMTTLVPMEEIVPELPRPRQELRQDAASSEQPPTDAPHSDLTPNEFVARTAYGGKPVAIIGGTYSERQLNALVGGLNFKIDKDDWMSGRHAFVATNLSAYVKRGYALVIIFTKALPSSIIRLAREVCKKESIDYVEVASLSPAFVAYQVSQRPAAKAAAHLTTTGA